MKMMNLVGNVAKFISDEEKAALVKTHELNHGDVLFTWKW